MPDEVGAVVVPAVVLALALASSSTGSSSALRATARLQHHVVSPPGANRAGLWRPAPEALRCSLPSCGVLTGRGRSQDDDVACKDAHDRSPPPPPPRRLYACTRPDSGSDYINPETFVFNDVPSSTGWCMNDDLGCGVAIPSFAGLTIAPATTEASCRDLNDLCNLVPFSR